MRHLGLLGSLEKGEQVINVAVDTTIRNQSQEVKPAISRLGPVKGGNQGRELPDRLILNRLVNPDNVLSKEGERASAL